MLETIFASVVSSAIIVSFCMIFFGGGDGNA